MVARRDGRAGGRGRSGGLPGPLARRDGGRRPAPAPSGADHRRPPRRAPRRTPPPRGRRRAAGRHRRARHRQDDAAGRSVAAGVDLRGPGRRAADPRRRALRARVGRAAPGLARRRGPVVRGGAGPLPRVRGTGAVPDPAGDRTGGSRRRGSLRGRPPVRGHRVHPCRAVVAPSAGARARGPALLRSQLARLHRAARRRWPGRPDRRQPAQRRVRGGRRLVDARASRGRAGAQPRAADPQGDPGAAAAADRSPAATRRRRARPRAEPRGAAVHRGAGALDDRGHGAGAAGRPARPAARPPEPERQVGAPRRGTRRPSPPPAGRRGRDVDRPRRAHRRPAQAGGPAPARRPLRRDGRHRPPSADVRRGAGRGRAGRGRTDPPEAGCRPGRDGAPDTGRGRGALARSRRSS